MPPAVKAWALTGQRNWTGAGGILRGLQWLGLPVEGSPFDFFR